jgi:hypothetical protein
MAHASGSANTATSSARSSTAKTLWAGLTIDSANPPASFTPKDRKFSQNNG